MASLLPLRERVCACDWLTSTTLIPAVRRQLTGRDIAAEFNKKIARYKQTLDEGVSPAVVARWIAEAEQLRDEALASRPAARKDDPDVMTAEEIASLLADLGDVATALQEGEPEHKLDLYRSLRLRLTYSAETQRCTP